MSKFAWDAIAKFAIASRQRRAVTAKPRTWKKPPPTYHLDVKGGGSMYPSVRVHKERITLPKLKFMDDK